MNGREGDTTMEKAFYLTMLNVAVTGVALIMVMGG